MKAVFITFALFIVAAVAQDTNEFVLGKVQHTAPPRALEQSLIVKGRRAKAKQFPYQVGLMLDRGDGGELSWCGGTLISDQWILTAAHCMAGIVAGDAYLGAYDRTNWEEPNQVRIHFDESNIIIHEKWDQRHFHNDISLIELPSPVEFNDYIKPAQLPKKNGKNYSDYVGVKAISSGWGRVNDTLLASIDKLRWIEVPIMPNDECRSYFNFPVVDDTNICVRAVGGRAPCNGDSGGPLVVGDKNPTLIGAVSFGLSTSCERLFPTVFTRVTSYLDWIDEHSGVVNE